MKLYACNAEMVSLYREAMGFLSDTEYDCFYDSYDMSEYMEKSPLSYQFVVANDGSFIDVLHKENHGSYIEITPFFEKCGERQKEEMVFLLNEYKKSSTKVVFSFSRYLNFDVEEVGLHRCNLTSSLDGENKYCLLSSKSIYAINAEDVNIIRDYIEEKTLKTLDLSKVSFKTFSTKELAERYSSLVRGSDIYDGNWINSSNNSSIIGFHYFNMGELFGMYSSDSVKYLIALDANDSIIGVVKYGTYGEGDYAHYGLNFIDVRKDCRRNGIAKKLIRELAKDFPNDLKFILSDESEMGKTCKMGDIFKETFKVLNPSVSIGFRNDFYPY